MKQRWRWAGCLVVWQVRERRCEFVDLETSSEAKVIYTTWMFRKKVTGQSLTFTVSRHDLAGGSKGDICFLRRFNDSRKHSSAILSSIGSTSPSPHIPIHRRQPTPSSASHGFPARENRYHPQGLPPHSTSRLITSQSDVDSNSWNSFRVAGPSKRSASVSHSFPFLSPHDLSKDTTVYHASSTPCSRAATPRREGALIFLR